MEILPSNRKSAELITAEKDERCVAIIRTYGSADKLYMQATSGDPSACMPSMVICMKTYGELTIRRQIAGRMKMVAMRMGETLIDAADTEIIAEAITLDSSARVLGYDLVMRFFHWLELGKYELYACKPRNVMEAWQQYAKTAIAEQNKIKSELESKKHDKEWREHQKQVLRGSELKAFLEKKRNEARDAESQNGQQSNN